MMTTQPMKPRKSKQLIRVSCVILSPVAIFFALFVWHFWSSASRYNDPFAVLSAMLQLQLTNERIVFVGGRSDILLIKIGGQTTLDDYLSRSGWKCLDWMGAEKQCQKGDQKMRVVNGAMTRYFRIIGLGHAPYIVRGAR